ncbi:hypothetical protein EDC01DRAFT_631812 [Geopyxis carbonaria]|nr:hypothetical protein EDC01DRAFT_631812 [Geopyxis carbonaria]
MSTTALDPVALQQALAYILANPALLVGNSELVSKGSQISALQSSFGGSTLPMHSVIENDTAESQQPLLPPSFLSSTTNSPPSMPLESTSALAGIESSEPIEDMTSTNSNIAFPTSPMFSRKLLLSKKKKQKLKVYPEPDCTKENAEQIVKLRAGKTHKGGDKSWRYFVNIAMGVNPFNRSAVQARRKEVSEAAFLRRWSLNKNWTSFDREKVWKPLAASLHADFSKKYNWSRILTEEVMKLVCEDNVRNGRIKAEQDSLDEDETSQEISVSRKRKFISAPAGPSTQKKIYLRTPKISREAIVSISDITGNTDNTDTPINVATAVPAATTTNTNDTTHIAHTQPMMAKSGGIPIGISDSVDLTRSTGRSLGPTSSSSRVNSKRVPLLPTSEKHSLLAGKRPPSDIDSLVTKEKSVEHSSLQLSVQKQAQSKPSLFLPVQVDILTSQAIWAVHFDGVASYRLPLSLEFKRFLAFLKRQSAWTADEFLYYQPLDQETSEWCSLRFPKEYSAAKKRFVKSGIWVKVVSKEWVEAEEEEEISELTRTPLPFPHQERLIGIDEIHKIVLKKHLLAQPDKLPHETREEAMTTEAQLDELLSENSEKTSTGQKDSPISGSDESLTSVSEHATAPNTTLLSSNGISNLLTPPDTPSKTSVVSVDGNVNTNGTDELVVCDQSDHDSPNSVISTPALTARVTRATGKSKIIKTAPASNVTKGKKSIVKTPKVTTWS